MKNNKAYMILFIVIIGLALVATIATYVLGKNESNSNENESNSVIYNEIENDSYSNFDVIYDNNTEVSYRSPNNYEFEQNLKIYNGILKITNKNTNETYALSSIKGLKSVMILCDGTDSECQRYVLLSNLGKVYYTSNNLYKIDNLKEFENAFTEIKIKYNISDIGYVSLAYPSAEQTLVIKDDNGQEYLVDLNNNNFKKINTVENSKSSCKNNCKEYSDIEIDKENNLEYSDNGNTIKLNVYPAYDYENSKFIIYFNNKEIYNIVEFTTNVKIFKFNDVYVVEFKQDQSQCGNVIDILIDNNGNVIGIPAENEKDTFKENQNEITPNLMKTEFDDSTNKVVAYKKICSMCPSNTIQVGFKYTYILKDNRLVLQNKENLYCE